MIMINWLEDDNDGDDDDDDVVVLHRCYDGIINDYNIFKF